MQCERTRVRSDLVREFGDYSDPGDRRLVDHSSYLDVEAHWQAIVRSLFRHNSCGRTLADNIDQYCVVALYANRPGHGVVLGSLRARHRLVIVNWGDVHFDPCLPI
jgi:hypothetical protein